MLNVLDLKYSSIKSSSCCRLLSVAGNGKLGTGGGTVRSGHPQSATLGDGCIPVCGSVDTICMVSGYGVSPTVGNS